MNKRLIDEQFDPDYPNDHPKNLIPELCRHFYNIGWATGTGGKDCSAITCFSLLCNFQYRAFCSAFCKTLRSASNEYIRSCKSRYT